MSSCENVCEVFAVLEDVIQEVCLRENRLNAGSEKISNQHSFKFENIKHFNKRVAYIYNNDLLFHCNRLPKVKGRVRKISFCKNYLFVKYLFVKNIYVENCFVKNIFLWKIVLQKSFCKYFSLLLNF